MERREIEIDEEKDHLLSDLTREYDGAVSKALTDLVQAHAGLETFAERSEGDTRNTQILTLRDHAEADFREVEKSLPEDLKTRNGL